MIPKSRFDEVNAAKKAAEAKAAQLEAEKLESQKAKDEAERKALEDQNQFKTLYEQEKAKNDANSSLQSELDWYKATLKSMADAWLEKLKAAAWDKWDAIAKVSWINDSADPKSILDKLPHLEQLIWTTPKWWTDQWKSSTNDRARLEELKKKAGEWKITREETEERKSLLKKLW